MSEIDKVKSEIKSVNRDSQNSQKHLKRIFQGQRMALKIFDRAIT